MDKGKACPRIILEQFIVSVQLLLVQHNARGWRGGRDKDIPIGGDVLEVDEKSDLLETDGVEQSPDGVLTPDGAQRAVGYLQLDV